MDDLWTNVFRRLDNDDRARLYAVLSKAANFDLVGRTGGPVEILPDERETAKRVVNAIRNI